MPAGMESTGWSCCLASIEREVEATLKNPIRQIPADHGRIESQGFIEKSGDKQLLQVISEGEVVVLVVTVMATSKFEKYGVLP